MRWLSSQIRQHRVPVQWTQSALFEGFSQAELLWLSSHAVQREFVAGEFLVEEGAASSELFVIESGEVVVLKRHPGRGARLHHITHLAAGDVVGELAVLDQQPRAASVRATGPVRAVCFEMIKLSRQAASAPEPHNLVYLKLCANLARLLAGKLRAGAEVALESEQGRAAIGELVVNVIMLLCGYMVVLAALPALGLKPANTQLVSLPLLGIFGFVSWHTLRNSGYPLPFFGISRRHLGPALRENVALTLLLIAACTATKWLLLQHNAASAGLRLIEYPDVWEHFADQKVLLLLGVYVLSAMVQELIVHATLQSMLERFLTGTWARLRAILASALLFAVSHLHTSLLFAVVVFFPGLLWGLSFSRHRNLVGIVLSHILVGVYVFFVMGVRFV